MNWRRPLQCILSSRPLSHLRCTCSALWDDENFNGARFRLRHHDCRWPLPTLLNRHAPNLDLDWQVLTLQNDQRLSLSQQSFDHGRNVSWSRPLTKLDWNVSTTWTPIEWVSLILWLWFFDLNYGLTHDLWLPIPKDLTLFWLFVAQSSDGIILDMRISWLWLWHELRPELRDPPNSWDRNWWNTAITWHATSLALAASCNVFDLTCD